MFNNQYILNLGGKISQKEFLAIILCYLFGLLHWVLFINYNNPSYTYADWAFFKQLLGITGYAFQHNEIPFHVELFVGETEQLFDQTFQTYRYFGKPWVTAPPQIFLLKFVDFHVYITLQGVIFYTLGFIGCYKWSERLSLPLVSTVLLLILFQLNGAIVSRMGIGHPNIAYGLMLIPWIFLILYDFVHERDQCRNMTIFLLKLSLFFCLVLMNADLHVFYQMVVVSGLIIILYPKKIIWWLGSIILSVILSLWYFVPVFLYSGYVGRAGEYVGWHGGYGSYPNSWYHDIGFDSQIWDILIYLPVNIVYSIFYHLIISVDASLDAVWEYNIYLGVPGTVITIACFLLAIKEFKWSKKNMLYYRYIIGLVLVFILSLSVVYQTAFEILHLMVPTFPVVDGVPSRFMNYALFAFFLISVTKYTSLFVFFSTNVKKKVEWFFIVVTTAFLLEHSYKWSVKQTEQRFELPPRDYPYQLLNLPQDEVYISVVTGSYLISFILISLTIVLYIKLSRSGKRTRST